MQSIQVQTRHGRQVWWLFAGLWVVAGVLLGIVPLVQGNTIRALTYFGGGLAIGALYLVIIPRAQAKSGLYIDRGGVRAVGFFAERQAPPGARANTALSTKETQPGVWLTLPNGMGKAKIVPGMLHVPAGALLGFLFRAPNELLVREPASADPAARAWRGTGAFWGDDNDAAIVQYVGQWFDGAAAFMQQTYHGNPGPAAYAMSDAARPRIPGRPTMLIPVPLLLLLLWMLGDAVVSAVSLLVIPAMAAIVFAAFRVHHRELVIEPTGFRARGLLLTKLIPARSPRLGVLAGRHGSAAIISQVEGGPPRRLPALRSHRALDPNNQLLVRYPRADDPNLKHWRPTGVTWADGGQHVAWYLQQAVDAVQAQAYYEQQQAMYAQPGQFTHVPV